MRELNDYEEGLVKKVSDTNETIRMVMGKTSLTIQDASANTTFLVVVLKEILDEMREIKGLLKIPEAPKLKDSAMKELVIKPLKEKPKSTNANVDKQSSFANVDSKKPPVPIAKFTPFILKNIPKLFEKPEEPKSVITHRLLDAGCEFSIDKLIELGFIKSVRRYECSAVEVK